MNDDNISLVDNLQYSETAEIRIKEVDFITLKLSRNERFVLRPKSNDEHPERDSHEFIELLQLLYGHLIHENILYDTYALAKHLYQGSVDYSEELHLHHDASVKQLITTSAVLLLEVLQTTFSLRHGMLSLITDAMYTNTLVPRSKRIPANATKKVIHRLTQLHQYAKERKCVHIKYRFHQNPIILEQIKEATHAIELYDNALIILIDKLAQLILVDPLIMEKSMVKTGIVGLFRCIFTLAGISPYLTVQWNKKICSTLKVTGAQGPRTISTRIEQSDYAVRNEIQRGREPEREKKGEEEEETVMTTICTRITKYIENKTI